MLDNFCANSNVVDMYRIWIHIYEYMCIYIHLHLFAFIYIDVGLQNVKGFEFKTQEHLTTILFMMPKTQQLKMYSSGQSCLDKCLMGGAISIIKVKPI